MKQQDKFTTVDTIAILMVLGACILFTFEALPSLYSLIFSMVV